MQDIEPFFNWRDDYVAAEDRNSPFYGREYSEFYYTNKIYNYYIHPQWDAFGSLTLYLKVLYADYDEGYAIIEMIGEWNDCLYDDSLYLKRELVDYMLEKGIYRYIFICENVLNFHGGDNDYYEEWYEDISDNDGWIAILNTHQHVYEEMKDNKLQYYLNFGPSFNNINWRPYKPADIYQILDKLVNGRLRQLPQGWELLE